LTAVCELYVVGYALWGSRPPASGSESLPDERLEA
jgi:hypothetical protein